MRRFGVGSYLAVAVLAAGGHRPAAAQEAPVVRPGDGTLDASGLVAFEAEYEQLGFPFLARLVRAEGPRPTWSFQMIVEGPRGVGIDHVGHFADDLGFAYRRFAYRAFRDEYLDVTSDGQGLTVRRMPRAEGLETIDPVHVEAPPVFDGTSLYWLFGLLPLEVGASWSFRTWSPTPDSALWRTSSPVRVAAKERITVADGSGYDAWLLTSTQPNGELRTWVVEGPPYLLRQELVGTDGDVTPVIELKRVR